MPYLMLEILIVVITTIIKNNTLHPHKIFYKTTQNFIHIFRLTLSIHIFLVLSIDTFSIDNVGKLIDLIFLVIDML